MIRTSVTLGLLFTCFQISTAYAADPSPAQTDVEANASIEAVSSAALANSSPAGATANNAKVIFYVPDPNAGRPYWSVSNSPTIPDDAAQYVSVVIQVDGDFEQFSQYSSSRDTQATASALTSTALIDAAVAASLKLTAEQRRRFVIVNASPAGFRFTRLEVALRKTDAVKWQPTDAATLLAALCDQLKSTYEESTRAAVKFQQQRLSEVREKIEVAEKKLRELKDKQRAARVALAEVASETTDISYTLRNTRSQRTTVVNDLNRLRARLAALEPVAGPLAAEWEQVVKLRTERLEELNQSAKNGRDVVAELKDAEVKLAEARAKLSDAKRGESTDAPRSNRVNEGPQLRSQIAEAEARLKPLNELMAKLEDPNLLLLAEQVPELQSQEQRVRAEITDLVNRLDSIRRMSQWEPRVLVTVLDGKPDEARGDK